MSSDEFEATLVKRNVLVIDGADNCAYDYFSVSEDIFKLIFPEELQNVEFIEDLLKRHSGKERRKALSEIMTQVWNGRVEKEKVNGVHGTLFYELKKSKRKHYPNKRDSDLDGYSRPPRSVE